MYVTAHTVPISRILVDIMNEACNFKTQYSSENSHNFLLLVQIRGWRYCMFQFNSQEILKNHKYDLSEHKFTTEFEEDSKMNFLDSTIKNTDGKRNFSIFYKSSYTDITILNGSVHQYMHKLSAFNSIIHRLNLIN